MVLTRILVTGANGFLGLPIALALAARGVEVHGVSRHTNSSAAVIWHTADLLDSAAAARAIDEAAPDVLVHAAWETGPGYQDSPANARWQHASEALLAHACNSGIQRVVGIGSCAEYDWTSPSPLSEDTPLHPNSSYGGSKAELSVHWLAAAEACGIEGVWARPFFLFGPREHPSRLVPSVARSVLAGVPAPITGGEQVLDFLSSVDAASFITDLVLGDVSGAVNIGSGTGTSVADLARLVAAAAGDVDLVRPEMAARESGATQVVADVGRLRQEVGSPPPRPLTEAVNDAVTWWRDHPSNEG